MHTATRVANRITQVVIEKFAVENGITPAHLTDDTEALTPTEILAATRALGPEVVFP